MPADEQQKKASCAKCRRDLGHGHSISPFGAAFGMLLSACGARYWPRVVGNESGSGTKADLFFGGSVQIRIMSHFPVLDVAQHAGVGYHRGMLPQNMAVLVWWFSVTIWIMRNLASLTAFGTVSIRLRSHSCVGSLVKKIPYWGDKAKESGGHFSGTFGSRFTVDINKPENSVSLKTINCFCCVTISSIMIL